MSNILIVEDDQRWQDYLNELLISQGYSTTRCSSPEDAMMAFNQTKIELAVVDINLSDVTNNRSGEAVIEYLKGRQSKLPIIVVSGTVPAYSIGTKTRIFSFFAKQDFDEDEFLLTVSKAIKLPN